MSPATQKSTRRKAKSTGGRRAGGALPFREKRQVAGLTLAEIAKMSGLCMPTVRSFELGLQVSSLTTNRLLEIYDALPGPMRPDGDPHAVNATWLRAQIRTFVREHGLTAVNGDATAVMMSLKDINELCRLVLTVARIRIVEE